MSNIVFALLAAWFLIVSLAIIMILATLIRALFEIVFLVKKVLRGKN